MGAGEEDIMVVLININDVCVLVGVIFGDELERFLDLSILVVEEQPIGVATEEVLIEGFYLVEGGQMACSEHFGERVFYGFGQHKRRLLLIHFFI